MPELELTKTQSALMRYAFSEANRIMRSASEAANAKVADAVLVVCEEHGTKPTSIPTYDRSGEVDVLRWDDPPASEEE